MLLEQVEQQVTLAATPDAGDNLHKAVALGVNESIQIEVSLDDHKFLRLRIISKITPPQHGIHSFFTVHAPKVRIRATTAVHVGLRLFRFTQSHLQPSPSSQLLTLHSKLLTSPIPAPSIATSRNADPGKPYHTYPTSRVWHF